MKQDVNPIALIAHGGGSGGITRAAACAVLLALAGCGSFGHTAYEVKASTSGKGCDLSAQDGKEFKGRNFVFSGRDCTLVVEEGESKAFKGQAIGAKVMTVLPVTGLQDLVKP